MQLTLLKTNLSKFQTSVTHSAGIVLTYFLLAVLSARPEHSTAQIKS